MAKGLRSRRMKTNKTALRARVFAPVEHARAERLSAKLLELASQPKPPRSEMEDVMVEERSKHSEEDTSKAANDSSNEQIEGLTSANGS